MNNIIENNQLIAQFMGKEWHKEFFKEVSIISPSNISYQFHSDWNWLMQVVDKVENVSAHFVVISNDCTIKSINLEYVSSSLGKTKIESVYNACISFIHWYNQQSK